MISKALLSRLLLYQKKSSHWILTVRQQPCLYSNPIEKLLLRLIVMILQFPIKDWSNKIKIIQWWFPSLLVSKLLLRSITSCLGIAMLGILIDNNRYYEYYFNLKVDWHRRGAMIGGYLSMISKVLQVHNSIELGHSRGCYS